MKKQYMQPEMLAIKIELSQVLAASDPLTTTSSKGSDATGGVIGSREYDDFDD